MGGGRGAGRVLARVRESNREGMLAKLEHLDERYLAKFFLGGKTAREVEMSEVAETPYPQRACAPAHLLPAHLNNSNVTTSRQA